METTKIYCLADPITGRVRYVGKSNNPTKRLGQHISLALGGRGVKSKSASINVRKDVWIRSLVDQDLKPELRILQEVPLSKWKSTERAWIRRMKDHGEPLLNMAPGGSYIPKSVRRKRRNNRKNL